MSREVTHTVDPDGHMVQVVSPQRLREILDADGDDYSRPSHFGPDDEWSVSDECIADPRFAAGDRVEAGEPGTDDHDRGVILAINGDRADVGWDSCSRCEILLSELRIEEDGPLRMSALTEEELADAREFEEERQARERDGFHLRGL